MTNDEAPRGGPFVIAVSSLIRHSVFGFRHSAVALLALVAVILAGCSSKPTEIVESRPAFGTTITIRAIGPTERSTKRVIAAGWAELDLCASHLDPALPTSDIALINAQAGGDPVPVDPLTATCLAAAKDMWQDTGGAFDPTAAPLEDLWSKARAASRTPTEDEIAKARALVGMDKVQIAGGLPPAASPKGTGRHRRPRPRLPTPSACRRPACGWTSATSPWATPSTAWSSG